MHSHTWGIILRIINNTVWILTFRVVHSLVGLAYAIVENQVYLTSSLGLLLFWNSIFFYKLYCDNYINKCKATRFFILWHEVGYSMPSRLCEIDKQWQKYEEH